MCHGPNGHGRLESEHLNEDGTKKFYFFDPDSQEATWEFPEKCAWEKRMYSEEDVKLVREKGDEAGAKAIEAMLNDPDSEHQKFYFWNMKTGETVHSPTPEMWSWVEVESKEEL